MQSMDMQLKKAQIHCFFFIRNAFLHFSNLDLFLILFYCYIKDYFKVYFVNSFSYFLLF
jgi:hypothetical protein